MVNKIIIITGDKIMKMSLLLLLIDCLIAPVTYVQKQYTEYCYSKVRKCW